MPHRLTALRSVLSPSLLGVSLLLAGCGAVTSFPDATGTSTAQGTGLRGMIHGGQQAVKGSHVHLMAAASSGYGAASVSLLNAVSTGYSDSIGAYVPTLTDGSFSVSNDYTCTSGQTVYALATQGDPGLGVNNAALSLVAVLGVCPAAGNFIAATPYVWINEVSTVAAAYSLAGFMTDATHLASANTTQSITGLQNAAAMALGMVPIGTGLAGAKTTNGISTLPQSKINTLANILASCINSDGSTPCANLFTLSKQGTATPTETATAMINIAHNAATNVTGLYNLVGAAATPFQPSLTGAPGDWALAINIPINASTSELKVALDIGGNGYYYGDFGVVQISPRGDQLSTINAFGGGGDLAISPLDGTVWTVGGGGVSHSGAAISDSTAAWRGEENALGFDRNGNVFVGNYNPASVGEFTSGGGVVNTTGYTSGGLTAGSASNITSVAVDSTGKVWTACLYCGVVTEMNSDGSAISPATGYKPSSVSAPVAVAIDASSNAWILDRSTNLLTKYSSTGTLLSGNGFAGGSAFGLAIDGSGTVWVPDYYVGLHQVSNAGVTTGTYAAVAGNPNTVAVDPSGNVWVGDYFSANVTVYVGMATPVVTPINPAHLGVRP